MSGVLAIVDRYLKDRTEWFEGGSIGARELYEDYKLWQRSRNGEAQLTEVTFGRVLTALKVAKKKSNGHQYLNIRLKAGTATMRTDTPAPSPAAIKAMRAAFALLEENFDPEIGRYKGDYSDDRVARETGLSVATVRQYRTEAFGAIKRPPELSVLSAGLQELEALFIQSEADLKAKISSLAERVRAFEKSFGG